MNTRSPKKITNFLNLFAGIVYVAHLKEQRFTARMKKAHLLIFCFISFMHFSCKEELRSLSIHMKQMGDTERILPSLYFTVGPMPDTGGPGDAKVFKITDAMFDDLAAVIKKELPLASSSPGVLPFFSVEVIKDSTHSTHAVDTRETMIRLIGHFKHVTDEDAIIAESGHLDEMLKRLQ